MIWNDRLEAVTQVIVSTDHPLSLGFRVKVITTSPYARKGVRVNVARMARAMNGSEAEGMCAVWPERKLIVIAINLPETTPGSKLRVIELVTHEVSHAVDGFFERAALEKIDTEIRAYYMDWMVGKIMNEFPKIVD